MPSTQSNLLIAVALARFSHEFEAADPDLSTRAWELAIDHAGREGLRPSEAVGQLNWTTTDNTTPRFE